MPSFKRLVAFVWLAIFSLEVGGYKRELCRNGGNGPNCKPHILTKKNIAPFMDLTPMNEDNPQSKCFLTDTVYTNGLDKCHFLKLYGNGIITYSTGGMYQYANDISYKSGGGGGTGYAHSQGPGADEILGSEDFFVARGLKYDAGGIKVTADGVAAGTAFDYYEHKSGIFTFGYYDCDKIVLGGAIDDYAPSYTCTDGIDLFQGCVRSCGPRMMNWTMYNFTSALYPDNKNGDTETSQLFG